jgi:hypothetical protein
MAQCRMSLGVKGKAYDLTRSQGIAALFPKPGAATLRGNVGSYIQPLMHINPMARYLIKADANATGGLRCPRCWVSLRVTRNFTDHSSLDGFYAGHAAPGFLRRRIDST